MLEKLIHIIEDKRIGILGFGLEGQSTFHYLRRHFGDLPMMIADRDEQLLHKTGLDLSASNIVLHTGADYLEKLSEVDVIFKSPGIAIPASFVAANPGIQITSQTAMVLDQYYHQTIGVTGTKGKSTTSSLINHILHSAGKDSILIGNIGVPPFDFIDMVTDDTHIVYELSSHQLEDIRHSPHISILLNLFPEHLDRYATVNQYFRAKWNIFIHQQRDDIFIVCDEINPRHLPQSSAITSGQVYYYGMNAMEREGIYMKDGIVTIAIAGEEKECCVLDEDLFLKGRHNRLNMMAAVLACHHSGVTYDEIMKGIRSFQGLEHRLEYVGNFAGIDFYNDSIATIPEAAMEAVQAIDNVQTLILGGYDRNLDYTGFVDFLMESPIRNFVFMGAAGKRMLELAESHPKQDLHSLWFVHNFTEAFDVIVKVTPPGSACMLSPAAASYDSFKNFEERGREFKKIARSL